MAKSKSLTELVPDFREALEEGVETATKDIVEQLKIAGPYYTGFFESLWQVNVGKTAIKADVKDPSSNKKQRFTRDYTPADVPESPNLQGYTIGNRANYRNYAMDIKPSPTGRGAYPAANLTAPKNWYDNYVNSKMPETINRNLWQAFRFRRN